MKLKILCLHGYRGSAEILRRQLSPLAASSEALADFVYLDAPSRLRGRFGWWHAEDSDGARRYEGWTLTREAIVAAFAELGPFDGILGFSQGAALAGLLVGLREQPLSFDFAIMASGFVSADLELAKIYDRRDRYNLPSLHLFCRTDSIVPSERSLALAQKFVSPILIEHDSGHALSSEPQVRGGLEAFLQEQLQRRSRSLELPLWPNADSARLRVFLPSARHASRAALVVFRGGAYATNQGSGGGAAEWAADQGMVGVEVPYRCQASGHGYPDNYADAARAVRLVREHARDWSVDPARVGVLGFSAGGHLASLLSTQPALYTDPADDLATRHPARPEVVILGSPVITFVEGYSPGAFASSVENFFGKRDLDLELRRRFSNELFLTPDHPPVFIWTTQDDSLVPASHTQRFARACESAGVPVMFQLFPEGPHGLGLAQGTQEPVGGWTGLLLEWLRARKLL